MTKRDRLTAKVERRQEWAEKAHDRAEQASARAHRIMDNIPLGQPILVGHHSEGHHRADIRRIDSAMAKTAEETQLARHHEQKADGLQAQLERSIYSDDHDAIAALEVRIAEREAEAARRVAVNKAWKQAKGDPARFRELASVTDDEWRDISRTMALCPWIDKPYPAYSLSNLRGNIRRDRERIEEIGRRERIAETARAAGGVTIEQRTQGYIGVTFAEKPARDILNALRAAGFYWGSGSWYGLADKLPAAVAAMEAKA